MLVVIDLKNTMKVNGYQLIFTIFFCVQQKKETHTSLKQDLVEDEYMNNFYQLVFSTVLHLN